MSRPLSSFQIVLTGMGLSDLFFNHEHPALEEIGGIGRNDEAETRDALMRDANGFIDCLGTLHVNSQEREQLAESLADDFLKRV